ESQSEFFLQPLRQDHINVRSHEDSHKLHQWKPNPLPENSVRESRRLHRNNLHIRHNEQEQKSNLDKVSLPDNSTWLSARRICELRTKQKQPHPAHPVIHQPLLLSLVLLDLIIPPPLR